MRVVAKSSFPCDIKKLRDAKVLARTLECQIAARTAASLQDLGDVVPMIDYPGYSRIRAGESRIDFHFDGDTIPFLRVSRRRDFYRSFP